MYKKFKKIFLVMSILGILFTNNYANVVKEVQLIDDFSAELLGETKNQEAEVPESPVQQQAQEITEDKNVGEEQIEESKDKITEDKEENKEKEDTIKNENSHKEKNLLKKLVRRIRVLKKLKKIKI